MGKRLLSQRRLHLLLSDLLSLKQLFLLIWAQLGFDLSQMVHLELHYQIDDLHVLVQVLKLPNGQLRRVSVGQVLESL